MFDLDGTLIEGHVRREGSSGKLEEVLPFEVVNVLPGRAEKVAALLDADVKVAVCTNKAEVAWGHAKILDCRRKRAAVEDAFGVLRADRLLNRWRWYEAYGYKDAPSLGGSSLYSFDDPDRKPRPGMLLRAMLELEEEPRTSLFVGDRGTDQEAAQRAEVLFAWTEDYFEEWSAR